jgi:hypothetical protein
MSENYNFSYIDEHQHPVFSAGLSQPVDVDGTYIGLDFTDRDSSTFAQSACSQPQSFSGFGLPYTLTLGEVSEVYGSIQDDFGLGIFNHTDMLGTVFSSGRDYSTAMRHASSSVAYRVQEMATLVMTVMPIGGSSPAAVYRCSCR